MMKLEKRPRRAPMPARAHESALLAIARQNRTFDRRWNRAIACLENSAAFTHIGIHERRDDRWLHELGASASTALAHANTFTVQVCE
jgi:hypothetical protein